MKLLTQTLRTQLPKLYAQEGALDTIIHIKYFTPDSNWTWYVTEGEEVGGDFRFFGFVAGHEGEWGYFMLSDLEKARGPLGLGIERDLYFEPCAFSTIKHK